MMEKAVTFFVFEDLKIKVERSEELRSRDSAIGCRAYELLKGVSEEDDWTREIDSLMAKHNIKFEIADESELAVFLKKSNSVTYRDGNNNSVEVRKCEDL
jgi:hypothetical protein